MDFVTNAFRQTIEVDIRPETVVFRCQGRSYTVAPVVYLSLERENPRLLGVGAPLDDEAYEPVALFAPGPMPDRYQIDKGICLQAFFHHAFRQVNPSFWFRPRVAFYGADSLEPLLNGYAQMVLGTAAGQHLHLCVIPARVTPRPAG
jgi:hypothetical protein